jgi:hypothetical protein
VRLGGMVLRGVAGRTVRASHCESLHVLVKYLVDMNIK